MGRRSRVPVFGAVPRRGSTLGSYRDRSVLLVLTSVVIGKSCRAALSSCFLSLRRKQKLLEQSIGSRPPLLCGT
eukprot:scaffold92832_cov27-Tisochrysis_lutea.AAC.1